MRVPIDYDGWTLRKVRGEALMLWSKAGSKIHTIEIWETSPGNHRLVLEADLTKDEAIYLVHLSSSDIDYLEFLEKRRMFTERRGPKGSGRSPAPRLVETHLNRESLLFN